MKIVYASRNPANSSVEARLGANRLELDPLFATADVVSLHIPGGSATRGLVDGRLLSLMKPSAILVNTARGDILDEEALVNALRRGAIAAAGLNVYAREPDLSASLRELENVVCYRIGSATTETRAAMGMRALANLDLIATGRGPLDPVI